MANLPVISPEHLRKMLRYDADTGKLFWLERSPDDVLSDRASTRQRIARNWNARFRGEALTRISQRGYHYGSIASKKHTAHRVAWALYYGSWPTLDIDHINGNPLDNRIENLREATAAENGQNRARPVRNKSGMAGVWWDKARGKYQVFIGAGKNRVRAGRFNSFEDAAETRKRLESELGYHPNNGRTKTTPSAA